MIRMMMIHLCKYIPSLRSFTMLFFLVLVILQDSEKVEKAFCIGSNKTAGSVHKVQTFVWESCSVEDHEECLVSHCSD